MGFEKPDNGQSDSNEWQSFQPRETGDSLSSPKDKDKKEKKGRHRASDSRPAFKLPDVELDNSNPGLAERRRSSWADMAFEGHDKADKDDATDEGAEIWKRSDIADAESVTDDFSAGDVEIRLHDAVAQPAQHGELVSEDVAEEVMPVPEQPEQPAPQPKAETSATSLRDILAGYPLPVAETAAASDQGDQEAPREIVHEAPGAEYQAEAVDIPEAEPASDIPPVPPSFSEYQRLIWGSEAEAAEPRMAMAAEMSATGAGGGEMTLDQPAVAPLYGTTRKRYGSDIPEGYQRSTSDVSRAAWTGVAAGWWLGRRGKRKAVEAAQTESYQKGHVAATEVAEKTNNARLRAEKQASYDVLPEQAPTLEAAPIHDIPRSETNYESHESRTTVMPTSVEVSRQKTNFAENIEASPETPITNDMGRGELMQIAKEIKIEGISLKDIYNAKRIDKEGLQAVVEVYLRGGDVKKQLSQEILAKEQSFERDPFLRKVRSSPQAEKLRQGVSSVAVAAGGLLAEVSGQVAAASHETAKKATKAISSGAKQAQHDIIDTSDSADWIGITAVVIVYALILILIFN